MVFAALLASDSLGYRFSTYVYELTVRTLFHLASHTYQAANLTGPLKFCKECGLKFTTTVVIGFE